MGIYERDRIQCGGITRERNLIVDGLETVPDSGLAQTRNSISAEKSGALTRPPPVVT